MAVVRLTDVYSTYGAFLLDGILSILASEVPRTLIISGYDSSAGYFLVKNS